MSPRPAPTTSDEVALTFLRAGGRLIDALLAPRTVDLPARLRSLHFPAPLGWIRVEDVIREAREGGATVSPKAFRNRWPDKDSYLLDLAHHAIMHTGSSRDAAPGTLALRGERAGSVPASFSAQIEELTRSVMAELLAEPRAFFFGHLAAVVHHAPGLLEPLDEATEVDNQGWAEFYDAAVASVGLHWRPGWDALRLQVAMRALIEGLLVRRRTCARPGDRDEVITDLFRDAATALITGAVDFDGDGRTPAQVLDDGVARALAPGA